MGPPTRLVSQGPAPKTAVQEDLPDFFSAENFANLEVRRTSAVAKMISATLRDAHTPGTQAARPAADHTGTQPTIAKQGRGTTH